MNTDLNTHDPLLRAFLLPILLAAAALMAAPMVGCEDQQTDVDIEGKPSIVDLERELEGKETAADETLSEAESPTTISDPRLGLEIDEQHELAEPSAAASGDDSCPFVGSLDETLATKPDQLLVTFAHPKGFQLVESENMDAVLSRRLEQPFQHDGKDEQMVVEIVQSSDGMTADKARQEMQPYADDELEYNRPAGTVQIGDASVPVVHSDKPGGSIYTMAIPDGSNDSANMRLVTLYIYSTAESCAPAANQLADELLQTLRPTTDTTSG